MNFWSIIHYNILTQKVHVQPLQHIQTREIIQHLLESLKAIYQHFKIPGRKYQLSYITGYPFH